MSRRRGLASPGWSVFTDRDGTAQLGATCHRIDPFTQSRRYCIQQTTSMTEPVAELHRHETCCPIMCKKLAPPLILYVIERIGAVSSQIDRRPCISDDCLLSDSDIHSSLLPRHHNIKITGVTLIRPRRAQCPTLSICSVSSPIAASLCELSPNILFTTVSISITLRTLRYNCRITVSQCGDETPASVTVFIILVSSTERDATDGFDVALEAARRVCPPCLTIVAGSARVLRNELGA